MLGATQAVLLGAAGCPFAGYAATVTGLPGLLAYWRFSDAATIVDETAGNRDGTYDGPVSLVSGLPAHSDQATRLGGTTRGMVPTDAGLDLAAFTFSFWIVVHEDPEDIRAVLAREQSGLHPGDFGLYYNDGEIYAQFQSASEQLRAFGPISVGTPHHIAVTAGGAGFALWVDGRLREENASFTGGWSSNDNDLVFGSAQQLAEELDITIDECAFYSRVLTSSEIIALSQNTAAPTVQDLDFTVPENQATLVNVLSGATFVGALADLIIQVWNGSTWGSAAATTNGDVAVSGQTVTFTADDLAAEAADSFDFRITDVNGTSGAGTASLTITVAGVGEDDGFGGTLIYDWQADGTWITNDGTTTGTFITLTSRDADEIRGPGETTDPSPNRWNDGASVGTVRKVGKRSNWNAANYSKMCWNFAPDGSPALEMCTTAGQHGVADFWLELRETLAAAGFRRMRCVMDLRLCHSSDPNTFKPRGKGTTTGSYPNFSVTYKPGHTNETAPIKYFCCVTCGDQPRGAALCNWWNDETRPIDGVGHMFQTNSAGDICIYGASFGRPNSGGFLAGSPVSTDDAGVAGGCWHRLENEIELGDPDDTPLDAVREVDAERPTGGVGVQRTFITLDVDGELGAAGTRQMMQQQTGLTMSPRADNTPDNDDNMHILCDCTGIWLDFYYGGQQVCQGEGWAWLRRIQVYGYD